MTCLPRITASGIRCHHTMVTEAAAQVIEAAAGQTEAVEGQIVVGPGAHALAVADKVRPDPAAERRATAQATTQAEVPMRMLADRELRASGLMHPNMRPQTPLEARRR